MDFVLWYTLLSNIGGEWFVCQNCPDCNSSAEPCQDVFGSNSSPEGGIVGRVDAVHTSIEAPKPTGGYLDSILRYFFFLCVSLTILLASLAWVACLKYTLSS